MNYSHGLQLADNLGLRVVEDIDGGGAPLGLCEYHHGRIRLGVALTEEQKLHVLIHEICHATGTEGRLNRMTLLSYGSCDVYDLVEELIVESATYAILTTLNGVAHIDPMKILLAKCEEQGIEFDKDVIPEVDRIMEFITPHIKELGL